MASLFFCLKSFSQKETSSILAFPQSIFLCKTFIFIETENKYWIMLYLIYECQNPKAQPLIP
jgi:hypothetical protein